MGGRREGQGYKAKFRAIKVEATSASIWAVKEYKKSRDFKDEVGKATYDAF